jgi:hypothetical protein
MELNHRPHAYQACALTNLSYSPSADTARWCGRRTNFLSALSSLICNGYISPEGLYLKSILFQEWEAQRVLSVPLQRAATCCLKRVLLGAQHATEGWTL